MTSHIMFIVPYIYKDNAPASREKGPSDITNSVDKDQPLHVVENSYT